MSITRRNFLATAALSSASAALASQGHIQQEKPKSKSGVDDMPGMNMSYDDERPKRPAVPRLPAIISRVASTVGIDEAYEMLAKGSDTLDVALHICKTQEDDPSDHTNGLGGYPNAQGEVQLDACCIHGSTGHSASVAAVSGIRNASLLAAALMKKMGTTHLVGSDAKAFALAHGFSSEDLMTDRSRGTYEVWKEISAHPQMLGDVLYDPSLPPSVRKTHFMPKSQRDLNDLARKCEPLAVRAGLPPALAWRASFDALVPSAEPLYVSAMDMKGQASCVSTSSGRPWRTPGASSDVAMIGAGCSLDPHVGSVGSSGSSEANIKIAGAHTIIENMRKGMSPEDAGMDALRRIARWYKNDMTALRFVEMVYYILRKDGYYASVSLWRGDKTGHARSFAIKDGDGMRRTEACLYLLDGAPPNGLRAVHPENHSG